MLGLYHSAWNQWIAATNRVLIVGSGGGGDAISALPTVWALTNAGKDVILVNVHTADNPSAIAKSADAALGDACFKLRSRPRAEGRARFSEIEVESVTGIDAYTAVSNHGAHRLAGSLRRLCEVRGIDGIFCLDSGSDLLAGLDTKITSILTDAISFAAVSMLTSQWFPVGVIGATADLEMDITTFAARVALAAHSGEFCGFINWDYCQTHLYGDVLQLARQSHPFSVTEAVLRAATGACGKWTNSYGQTIDISPLMCATFVFGNQFVRKVNPFVELCHASSFEQARASVCDLLSRTRPGERNWHRDITD